MNKEEIYFLRKIGLSISDEKEIVTTDSIDKFPNIINYMDEMSRISNTDMSGYIILLKNTVYTSCMMHYTVNVFRKKLISKEIFDEVMKKAAIVLRKANSDLLIAMTLLYEGPYYLHPEIFPVYQEAGYSKIVDLYVQIFQKEIEKAESEREFIILHNNEKEAYMELYEKFMADGFSDFDQLGR